MLYTLLQNSGEFRYANRILRSEIKIGKPKSPNFLSISKSELSNNYYSITAQQDPMHYRVPIGPHPDFPLKINQSLSSNQPRCNSIFMTGNIDMNYYKRIDANPNFNVISRYSVYRHLKEHENFLDPISLEELFNYCNGKITGKIILINTSQRFQIRQKDYAIILSNFKFYLALPGIEVPESHNLFEAMSLGCIPIIHNNYANLFQPKLEHKINCLTYETLEELDALCDSVFNMDEQVSLRMSKNVLDYYKNYFSANAVVQKIVNRKIKRIYIQAEIKSLHLLNSSTI